MDNRVMDLCFDLVIGARYIVASADYDFAIHKLVPRMLKLDFQRAPIEADLYERLYKDFIQGCIVPPITVAILQEKGNAANIDTVSDAQAFLDSHVDDCFILDGVQRLHTLNRANKSQDAVLDLSRPIYINYVVTDSMDKLLYRMITLNNGQKPMSIRHQVEILADNMFDFDLDIKMVTEKERKTGYKSRNKVELNKASVVTAYLAYMSGSTTIDNKKIVDNLLNQLIADKILAAGISDTESIDFQKIVNSMSIWMSEDQDIKKWLKIENNLIGFCAAARNCQTPIYLSTSREIKQDISKIELVFSSFEKSRIKMQTVRRKINYIYFSNFVEYRQISGRDFLEIIMQEII